MVHDVPATTLATPTLQCSIKMDLCASLTLVRQGLFLFLSSYCWRAPCETWSALLYFHGVHVLLVFFFLSHCSVFSEEKIFRDAWWVLIGKMKRSVGIIYSQYVALQPQTSSQKSSASCTKEGHCLAPQRDLCHKDKSTRVKFSGSGAQGIL